jgi:TonB family protein
MKPANPQPHLGFWIWGFLFIFLLHAFAVFWFAERPNAALLWQKPAAFLFLSSDADMDLRLNQSIALHDPMLFSLPHARGFSGGAWLQLRPPLPKVTNWSAPSEWLELSLDQLGHSLNSYMATNRPSEEQLLGSLRETKTPEVRIPDKPLITQTIVKVEGPLTVRRLVRTPYLPPATHTDLLRRTVLTVSVNGDGVVVTAAVANSSGSKAADANAVELARQFEFAPSPIRDAGVRATTAPTIGLLVFTWQVVPPTNTGPATVSLQ